MNDSSGQWAWMNNERPVQSQLKIESLNSLVGGSPASDASVVIALRLRLEGLPQEALRVLSMAKADPDVSLLMGQIFFEMERFEDAAESYAKLAKNSPDHP